MTSWQEKCVYGRTNAATSRFSCQNGGGAFLQKSLAPNPHPDNPARLALREKMRRRRGELGQPDLRVVGGGQRESEVA